MIFAMEEMLLKAWRRGRACLFLKLAGRKIFCIATTKELKIVHFFAINLFLF